MLIFAGDSGQHVSIGKPVSMYSSTLWAFGLLTPTALHASSQHPTLPTKHFQKACTQDSGLLFLFAQKA